MATQYPRGKKLEAEDHVARYCRGRFIAADGKLLSEAFLLRANEEYLSANWLEHFHANERNLQIPELREALQTKGWNLQRSGRFAVLNVGATNELCRQSLDLEVQFINLQERRDPSHTGIFGLQINPGEAARLLAESVNPNEVYPAIP